MQQRCSARSHEQPQHCWAMQMGVSSVNASVKNIISLEIMLVVGAYSWHPKVLHTSTPVTVIRLDELVCKCIVLRHHPRG